MIKRKRPGKKILNVLIAAIVAVNLTPLHAFAAVGSDTGEGEPSARSVLQNENSSQTVNIPDTVFKAFINKMLEDELETDRDMAQDVTAEEMGQLTGLSLTQYIVSQQLASEGITGEI